MKSRASQRIPSSGTPLREGFTLLEVLLSMVILSMIIILLAGMSEGASRLWRDGASKRESAREAGAGLQMIGEDLRSAVVTTNPATLVIGKESGDGTGSGPGNNLFFTSLEPDALGDPNSEGGLCAIGYFVASDPKKGPVGNLYRFRVSGKNTSEAFSHDQLTQLYTMASLDNPATELLARNILRLEVKPLFPERQGMPSTLMITLWAVGGETARQLSSCPTSSPESADLLRRHLQSYTTLIRLPPCRELYPAE